MRRVRAMRRVPSVHVSRRCWLLQNKARGLSLAVLSYGGNRRCGHRQSRRRDWGERSNRRCQQTGTKMIGGRTRYNSWQEIRQLFLHLREIHVDDTPL
jgi:hypothetical protein